MDGQRPSAVLLARELDQRSPSRHFDAQVLAREIEDLERAVHPVKLITAVRRKGSILEVRVLAASEQRRDVRRPLLEKPGHPEPREQRPPSAPTQVSAWRPEGW